MHHRHQKGRLSSEIVVPVATENIAPIDVPKQTTVSWHRYLLSLNIDTHGSNILRVFKFYFMPKLASSNFKIRHVSHSFA
jgi:hypothetical protein